MTGTSMLSDVGAQLGTVSQIDAGLLNVGYVDAGPAGGPALSCCTDGHTTSIATSTFSTADSGRLPRDRPVAGTTSSASTSQPSFSRSRRPPATIESTISVLMHARRTGGTASPSTESYPAWR